MPKGHFIQTNFTGGEWSGLLEGRVDLAKYGNALRRLENVLLYPHGPAQMRPGFRYIAGAKHNSKRARLIPFEFSTEQAYILEFGDGYLRFYKDQGRILSGGVPYEIAAPYLEADLPFIKFCQSADVLYLFHPDYAPRKLSRAGHTTWTLQAINFNPPATKEQPVQPAAALSLSAVSGASVTFTAGAGVFQDGDVDRIIRSGVGRASVTAFVSATQVTCEVIDTFSTTGPLAAGSWEILGSPSGAATPSAKGPKGAICTLTSGKNSFRSADVGKYVLIHDGFVKITQYTSAMQVSGEILKELSAVTASTTWSLESTVWNAANGYPSCGTFFEERICVAGVPEYPETVWGSVVGDYENFTPGVDDADALEFTIAGRQVNVIRWIEPREYMILGAVGGEWRLGPSDQGSPLTPLNVVAKQQTTHGCADLQPVTIGESTIFLQRAGRKLREFTWKWENEKYTAPDLTRLAEHITAGGIADMAYQQEPLSILWCARVDGTLLGLTYLRDEEVIGWHRHPIDGAVESVAVIPGNGYDELWAVVRRTVNGATVRYVEMLEKIFEDDADAFAATKGLNAFFVDCGLTYSGAPATVISGLGHLEGRTVAALADGAVVENRTVSGGQITLSAPASVVHVGLPYTALLETMRLDLTMEDGTAQGRKKRISEVAVRIHRSGPFKAGRDESSLDAVPFRDADMEMDAPPPLFTGDKRIGVEGRFDNDARLTIVQDKPLPLTVVAVMPEVSIW